MQAHRDASVVATPLTRALDTVRKLKAQLGEQNGNTPMAVVGVGLRLPGGINDLDSCWERLADGRDLVQSLPDSRKGPFAAQWERLPHTGGFLDDVMDFDADFFGLGAQEASGLDPQQRLMLEVAWEALENAALPPDQLDGARTGLFIGITGQEYWDWHTGELDTSWAAGNGHCFAVGRLAYEMNVTGPAITVDTACSSSLVSVHLARQALSRKECDVAVAGGVNLVLSPRATRLHHMAGMLSPDGVCKAFDAGANGFARGEGAGMVVLKRLEDARRDGDRIHAVLQGSAVNQSGRSNGFGAPNVLSQISLIETALADAGLSPADIGLVEAHGTGTSLGDTIEMEAIAAALGRKNGGAVLPVGSLKTNMGHLESAAGIAAMIKAILCLQHRAVPPLVHFSTPNPLIDLDGTGITLPTALEPWQETSGRYAAVSAFGMGGTNAHIILGAAEEPDQQAAVSVAAAAAPVRGFELATKTPQVMRELAGRFHERLTRLPAESYPAFAYTATSGRSRHRWRARVAAPDKASALEALRSLADGQPVNAVALYEQDQWRDADWPELDPIPRAVVDLPPYPWARQRCAPMPHAPQVHASQVHPPKPLSQNGIHGSPTPESDPPSVIETESNWSRRPFDRALNENHRLLALRPGILVSLTPTLWERVPPKQGQVEIEVAAAGLNFSDVLKAMGAYPGTSGRVPLGVECAGRISAVGDGVDRYRVGDPVMAVVSSAMAAYATTESHLVAPWPKALTDEQAAATPIAFLTAVYGLDHLARLRADERVLIHSATGGVGLAALMVARQCGAEVLATAGTPEKRDLLRSLGVSHVMDSRSLAFADEITELTDGYGVDVVLNSLTGESLVRSLALLAPGGRFVEIGKRDIYDDTRVGLGSFKHNRAMFAVDMEQVLFEQPRLAAEMFEKVLSGFEDGAFEALPVTSYSYGEAGKAFARMAQAQHAGKVVLRPSGDEEIAVPPTRPRVEDGVTSSLTAGLGSSAPHGPGAKASVEINRKLLAVEPGRRRRAVLIQHCREVAAQVLGGEVAQIDPAAPLAGLGFDSMRTLELRARLEGSLGVKLPATLGWQFPTIEALAPFLAERMGIELEAAATTGAQQDAGHLPPVAPDEEPTLEGLSDTEMEALLLAKIEQFDEGQRR